MTKKKLQDEFRDLALNEPIEIELDGKTVHLDVRAPDLHPLMQMGQDGPGASDNMDEVYNALKKILKRTYLTHYDKDADEVPENLTEQQKQENEEDLEWIEGLLVRYYPKIFEQISVSLGWADEDEIERRKQQATTGNQISPQK